MKSRITKKLFILYSVLLALILTVSECGRLSVRREERNESEFSYRTMLFEKYDKHNTPLKPDSDSNPLRISREELGRFTWAFLHSVAAAYPKNPTEDEKTNLSNLINSIPYLYPCKDCAGHFKKMLEKYPIKNSSREELVGYICFLHNKVNERLKKPIFDCQKAFNYWGGDCGCGGGSTEEQNKPTNSTITESE